MPIDQRLARRIGHARSGRVKDRQKRLGCGTHVRIAGVERRRDIGEALFARVYDTG